MRAKIAIGVFAIVMLQGLALGQQGQRVTTLLRVVDTEGVPLEGMEAGISYPDFTGNKYDSADGQTDESGAFSYRGKAYKEVYYSVKKAGYYMSHGKAPVTTRRDGRTIYIDPFEMQVVAKKVRHPIVMLATKRFSHVVPAGTRVGFDFFKNDLVEPYGEGVQADVFFSISGEFEDRKNHDSLLSIEFASEGDGLIPFSMDYFQGSILESDHEAPLTGYQREKQTRKMAKEITGLDPERPGYVKYESVDEVEEGIGYYIRIRTVLDEEGEIVSAYYGKVYGDFGFFGAHPDGSFVRADAYYINPTPNDRNVEAVPGESLLEGIKGLDLPNWP